MSTLRTTAFPTIALRAAALVGLLVGCGSTAEPVNADEAFRRIQVYEAQIAHRTAAAQACAPDSACEVELELCAAVEGLCEVSRSIEDPDARARCATARRHCPETP